MHRRSTYGTPRRLRRPDRLRIARHSSGRPRVFRGHRGECSPRRLRSPALRRRRGPAARRADLQPYLWFLDRANGDGLALTSAGYLKPADVTAASAVLPTMRHWIGTKNRQVQCSSAAVLPRVAAAEQAVAQVQRPSGTHPHREESCRRSQRSGRPHRPVADPAHRGPFHHGSHLPVAVLRRNNR